MRTKLPDRRRAVTDIIVHNDATFHITFGCDDEAQIREVFCSDARIGSDIHALIMDSCILISIYLQSGGEMEKLVSSLGENRNEKDDKGPPSSIMGAIARAIVDIQNKINKGEIFDEKQT